MLLVTKCTPVVKGLKLVASTSTVGHHREVVIVAPVPANACIQSPLYSERRPNMCDVHDASKWYPQRFSARKGAVETNSESNHLNKQSLHHHDFGAMRTESDLVKESGERRSLPGPQLNLPCR